MTEVADHASDASAAAIAAWEDPPRRVRADTAPVLSIDGFAGPLDWLLEMVRGQKIDLARLSIAALIEAATGRRFSAASVSRRRAALGLASSNRNDWSAPLIRRRWLGSRD